MAIGAGAECQAQRQCHAPTSQSPTHKRVKLANTLQFFEDRDADIVLIQEHAAASIKHRGLQTELRNRGWQAHLGPLQEGGIIEAGGVGLLVRGGRQAKMCRPLTKNFGAMFDAGRVARFVVNTGSGQALQVYSVYAWTGAATDRRAAG